jgi:hypothetical protein
MASIDIRIGGEDEYLLITVLDCADANDSEDWLVSRVEARVAGGEFTAFVSGQLRAEEFVVFSNQLKELYRTLAGKAHFSTMERWVDVLFTGNRLGQIEVECVIRDYNKSYNKLSFRLDLEQSYIPDILKSLARVTQQFPPIEKN